MVRHKYHLLTLILIVSLALIISPNNIISLNVGNHFIYEITEAGYYAKFEDKQAIFDAYRLGTQKGSIGTIVNATVESVEPYGDTFFRFWIDNKSSVAYFRADWFDLTADWMSYRIIQYIYKMIENFNEIYLAEMVIYQIRPFMHPSFNDYLDNPKQLQDDINSFFGKLFYLYPDIKCSYEYFFDENILYFESWIGGKVNAPFGKILTDYINYPSNISFGNQFHFAVNKDTGIVQGFGERGWLDGMINDQLIRVSMSCEYQLVGYDLPGYQFGSYNNYLLNNNNLVIILSTVIPGTVVIAVGSLLITRYLSKRRKDFRNS